MWRERDASLRLHSSRRNLSGSRRDPERIIRRPEQPSDARVRATGCLSTARRNGRCPTSTWRSFPMCMSFQEPHLAETEGLESLHSRFVLLRGSEDRELPLGKSRIIKATLQRSGDKFLRIFKDGETRWNTQMSLCFHGLPRSYYFCYEEIRVWTVSHSAAEVFLDVYGVLYKNVPASRAL